MKLGKINELPQLRSCGSPKRDSEMDDRGSCVRCRELIDSGTSHVHGPLPPLAQPHFLLSFQKFWNGDNLTTRNRTRNMAAPATKRRKIRHGGEDDSASDSGESDVLHTDIREEKRRAKAAPPKQAHSKANVALQDGVYTAEVYKSNVFKLQVDELLEQVRLKHGKKVASAENAMRSLKSLIEQIPARDALSVCTETPR